MPAMSTMRTTLVLGLVLAASACAPMQPRKAAKAGVPATAAASSATRQFTYAWRYGTDDASMAPRGGTSHGPAVTLDAKGLSSEQAFKSFQNAQGELSGALSRLMVVVEKYPDLKANQNFRDLQSQLEGTENRIAVARKRYIETVAEYNKGVRFFPTNLTAKYLLHLEPRSTFEAEASAQKAPAVKF